MGTSIGLLPDDGGALTGLQDICNHLPSRESDLAGQHIDCFFRVTWTVQAGFRPIFLGDILIPPVDAGQVYGIIPKQVAAQQRNHAGVTTQALAHIDDQSLGMR